MAGKCLGIIQFCRTRVTLLDSDGSPAAGPDNFYVSDQMVSLAITSDVEEGTRRTVRTGCDCVALTQRSADTLLGYTFELVDGVWEPALLSMMLGYDALLSEDGASVIGYNVSGDQLVCGGTQAKVALEAWSYGWQGAGQDADYPVVHMIWPLTQWQVAPATLGADPTTPTLTGFSQRNENWTNVHGDGPTDGTAVVVPDFFAMYGQDSLSDMPTASCGLQSTTP